MEIYSSAFYWVLFKMESSFIFYQYYCYKGLIICFILMNLQATVSYCPQISHLLSDQNRFAFPSFGILVNTLHCSVYTFGGNNSWAKMWPEALRDMHLLHLSKQKESRWCLGPRRVSVTDLHQSPTSCSACVPGLIAMDSGIKQGLCSQETPGLLEADHYSRRQLCWGSTEEQQPASQQNQRSFKKWGLRVILRTAQGFAR